MSRELPTPAPWIEDLPRDERGFVVPAEAGWQDGKPILSKVSTSRKVALGMRRACAVCGYPMPKGTTVYRAFAQADAAHMRQHERERAQDPSGPLHYSCILYSAMVCPHLREKNARMSKDSDINPGGRRGTLAAIMGFRDFGLMVYAQPHQFLDPAVPEPNFIYLEMLEDITYRDGEELRGRYEDAVDADSVLIDTKRARVFWTDDASDEKALGRALKDDFKALNRKPDFYQAIQGQGQFAAHVR
ncbi:hypothetical protein [Rhodococcus sp. 3A]|nr:hypothetical protein [Rhodococcus sp. 3A]MBC2644998.1 hypothetical protein [Rhodococcus sp. 3A]